MPIKTKYDHIRAMRSIAQLTRNMYPTLTDFRLALSENRVSGDYTDRINIVSNNRREAFVFVSEARFHDLGPIAISVISAMASECKKPSWYPSDGRLRD